MRRLSGSVLLAAVSAIPATGCVAELDTNEAAPVEKVLYDGETAEVAQPLEASARVTIFNATGKAIQSAWLTHWSGDGTHTTTAITPQPVADNANAIDPATGGRWEVPFDYNSSADWWSVGWIPVDGDPRRFGWAENTLGNIMVGTGGICPDGRRVDYPATHLTNCRCWTRLTDPMCPLQDAVGTAEGVLGNLAATSDTITQVGNGLLLAATSYTVVFGAAGAASAFAATTKAIQAGVTSSNIFSTAWSAASVANYVRNVVNLGRAITEMDQGTLLSSGRTGFKSCGVSTTSDAGTVVSLRLEPNGYSILFAGSSNCYNVSVQSIPMPDSSPAPALPSNTRRGLVFPNSTYFTRQTSIPGVTTANNAYIQTLQTEDYNDAFAVSTVGYPWNPWTNTGPFGSALGSNIMRVDSISGWGQQLRNFLLAVPTDTQYKHLQSGVVDIGDNWGSSVVRKCFNFPAGAFSSSPLVFVTPHGEGDYTDTFAASIASSDESGFCVNIARINGPTTWGQNLRLSYIAFDRLDQLQTMVPYVTAGSYKSGSNSSGGTKSVRVTPEPTFPGTPSVLLSVKNTSSAYSDTFVANARSVQPGRFDVNLYRVDPGAVGRGWGQEPLIHYLEVYWPD